MKLVWQDASGRVKVTTPTPEFISQFETEAEAIAAVIEKDIPAGVQVIECQDGDIPADRYFRKAWRLAGNALTVDRKEAEAVHMDAIREVRNAKLDKLDRDYTRAQGRKDQASADAVEAERERLRQIPQTFDLSTAPDLNALKAMWPNL